MSPETSHESAFAMMMQHTLSAPTSPTKTSPTKRLSPQSGILTSTKVLTRSGFAPAGQLRTGDVLITRNASLIPILSAEKKTVRTRIVCFQSAMLDAQGYHGDLHLPAHQLVNIRGWRAKALYGKAETQVSAASLIDDDLISDDGMREVEVVRLNFQCWATLYVGGLEVLSAHSFDDQLRPVYEPFAASMPSA